MVVGTQRHTFSLPTVAQVLGKTQQEVRELTRHGVLTAVDPGTRTKAKCLGKYKKWHYDPAEVEAYRLGEVEGVVEYRKRLKRKGK